MKLESLQHFLRKQLRDLNEAVIEFSQVYSSMARATPCRGLGQTFVGLKFDTTELLQNLKRLGFESETFEYKAKCPIVIGMIAASREAIQLEAPQAIVNIAIIAAARQMMQFQLSTLELSFEIATFLEDQTIANEIQRLINHTRGSLDKLMTQMKDEQLTSASLRPLTLSTHLADLDTSCIFSWDLNVAEPQVSRAFPE